MICFDKVVRSQAHGTPLGPLSDPDLPNMLDFFLMSERLWAIDIIYRLRLCRRAPANDLRISNIRSLLLAILESSGPGGWLVGWRFSGHPFLFVSLHR